VKELTLEEVLRIAGGVPHDADRDPLDRKRLLGNDARPSEPV
jgi:hypothetical protein